MTTATKTKPEKTAGTTPEKTAEQSVDTSLGLGPTSLEVMETDTLKMRGDKPFVFANMKTGQGLDKIM